MKPVARCRFALAAAIRLRNCLALALLMGACPGGAVAASPTAPVSASSPATSLKRLSLEQLLAMDITSVSRRPERFSQSASAVSVITGDDVRRSGATMVADALRYSTGLQVARIDGHTWGVASRGFNLDSSNKLLVLLDGRSLYTPLFSGVLWDVQNINMEDVDRIEVVRGPGATMWGANAVNGVINIQMKHARDTLGTLVTAGGGNEERQFASFRHGLKLRNGIHGRVYARQYRRDDLVLPNGEDAKDDTRMWQAGFRIDGEATRASNLWTVHGDLYHGFFGSEAAPDTRVAGGNIVARGEHTFAPDRSLHIQVYYDRVERSAPGQFRESRDTLDLDLQFNTAIGTRQQLVAGIGARGSEDVTGTGGVVRFNPPDRRMTVLSGFVEDEIRSLDERVGVIFGAKFEENNSTGFEFQPNVRAAWWPNQQQTVWAAISRAVRTPSRADDDLRLLLPEGGILLSGHPSFQSERLTAFELGYRLHLQRGWALDLALYTNRYDDLRSQEQSREPGVMFVLDNQLNARTYGGEISVSAELTKGWRIRGMYARLHKSLSLDPGSTDLTGGLQEGNDPKDHWTLVSSWDLPQQLELDLLLRHVSSLPAPVVPAYSELDLHLAWQPSPEWTLALVGQNLLHDEHREFGSDRLLERSVYAKATWQF